MFYRPKRKYRGWFGRTAKKRCPHANKVGIYGDLIYVVGPYRLHCEDCGRYLDGHVSLAERKTKF